MSFSIDLRELNHDLMEIQYYINQFDTSKRFVVQRLTAYATLNINVTPSPSLDAALHLDYCDDISGDFRQAQQALDWQPADPERHARDEGEVLHYLKHLNDLNPYRRQYGGHKSSKTRTASLLTSSLHGTASAEHHDDDGATRDLSSFRRHLWRVCLWERPTTFESCRYYTIQHCSDALCRQVLWQKPCAWASYLDAGRSTMLVAPRHSDASISRAENWVLELDVVDRWNPRRITYGSSWKRPLIEAPSLCRTDQSRPVVAAAAQEMQSRLQGKRFNGTRYREDRKKWLAVTRVPNHKHKVSFGTFKSEGEAARAVDAAFHYYNKPHQINFPDSPCHLPPAPAGEFEKLSFVKEQAQRMASLAFAVFPSSSKDPPWWHCRSGPIANVGDDDPVVNFLENSPFQPREGYVGKSAEALTSGRHRRNAVQITEVNMLETEGESAMSGTLDEVTVPEASLQLRHLDHVSEERKLFGGSPGAGFRVGVDLPSLSDDCFDCLPHDPFLHVSE